MRKMTGFILDAVKWKLSWNMQVEMPGRLFV